MMVESTSLSRSVNVRVLKANLDVSLDFSRPGKPTDNAFIESFNGKFRAECLNTHWFMSLDDARLKMEEWRRDYNEVRPHSAIGNKPPISLINSSSALSPP
jgi:putative transposase